MVPVAVTYEVSREDQTEVMLYIAGEGPATVAVLRWAQIMKLTTTAAGFEGTDDYERN